MRNLGCILTALLLVGLVLGGFVTSSMQDRNRQEEARLLAADRERANQAARDAVIAMVARTGANDRWPEQLAKGASFRESFFTFELEKLWLTDRPIMFAGAIRDISGYDAANYRIVIEQNQLMASSQYIWAELHLSLIAPRGTIDRMLEQYPETLEQFWFENGVAVAAQVRSISSDSVVDYQGDRKMIRIGEGDLIDIQYIGDMLF